MANRTQVVLHRWLPFVAAGAAAVLIVTATVIKPYADSLWRQEVEASRAESLAARGPTASPAVLPAMVVADARAVLDRASQAATSLDGDPRIVEAIAQIVAENDTIQRLWVVNDRGSIVYFGKERPAQAAVEKLAPEDVHRLLQGLPEGLLGADQRLAILIHAAVQTRQTRSDGDVEGHYRGPDRRPLHTEVRRIQGGWLAVAAQKPQARPYEVDYSIHTERTVSLRKWCNGMLPLSFLVYWLSLPGWVTLDALRRGERAAVWGIFTLVGNLIGLLVYLLSRRED